jgi:hypothetical protein
MIFVSYCSSDNVQCDEIVRALEEKGFKVWRDTKSITGGSRWRAEIEKGIKGSEIFVILLSRKPSVHAQEELEFAHKNQKNIIPVRLSPEVELPAGYEIILGGRQQITFVANEFTAGLEKLFEALGHPDSDESAGPTSTSLWRKALRKAQHYRALAANSDLASKALKTGLTVGATAAALAVAFAKANEKQRAEALQKSREREDEALQKYRDSVDRILLKYACELKRAWCMNVAEIEVEIRPRVRQLLCELEDKEVPVERLKQNHLNLVANLRRTIQTHDDAISKLKNAQIRAYQREMERLYEEWMETVQNYMKLLDSLHQGDK